MIRIVLPYHLRTHIQSGREVTVEVADPAPIGARRSNALADGFLVRQIAGKRARRPAASAFDAEQVNDLPLDLQGAGIEHAGVSAQRGGARRRGGSGRRRGGGR